MEPASAFIGILADSDCLNTTTKDSSRRHKRNVGFRSVRTKRKPGRESKAHQHIDMSITLESTQNLQEMPITAVSVIKNRTGGWFQQDGLRDLIGESFKAQRHNMYFHCYMGFCFVKVHQRPHYVTIHNTESHEERKKSRIPVMVTKKKNDKCFLFVCFFLICLKIQVCQIQSRFLCSNVRIGLT